MIYIPAQDLSMDIFNFIGSRETLMNEERRALVFVNLNKYLKKTVSVKLANGDEVCGILVNYDQVPNVVLKRPSKEGAEWNYGSSVICIGTSIMSIALGEAELKL